MSRAQSYLFFRKQIEELKDHQKIFTCMVRALSGSFVQKCPMFLQILFHMATHLREAFQLAGDMIEGQKFFHRMSHESLRFRNSEMQALTKLFLFYFKSTTDQHQQNLKYNSRFPPEGQLI